MARRSLKPQLNQIRSWVRQGRTDAWIAHQLEVSATELREFRKQHDLTPDDENAGTTEGVDLRDEIEAEVQAATVEAEAEEEAPRTRRVEADEAAEAAERPRRTGRGDRGRRERGPSEAAPARGRRGGRGRRKEIEATFDHGETDGYGLWLDASVKDNPVYLENWAGKREVTVRIEPDQIVIRRPGADEPDDDDDDGDE